MSDANNLFQARYVLNPVYWPTWLVFGFLWLTTKLPYRYIILLGKILGVISYVLMAERRRITRTNIALCFPELSKQEQRRLIRESFYNVGMALFESALAWWGDEKKLQPLFHYEGLEHIKEAEAKGKGIILLGGHYMALDMGARVTAMGINNVIPTYKKARNKIVEMLMSNQRKQLFGDVIRSMNMREVVRALKNKKNVWYAPDQDFGQTKSSVFAPFLGVPAITLTFTSRLAKLSGAPVLPWYLERLPDCRGYKLTIIPPLTNFPSGDDVLDATQINDAIGNHVKKVPEQYVWGHRRFKTRPHGEPQVYKPRRVKHMRRYTLAHIVLAIPAVIYTAWIAARNRTLSYFLQRTGITLPAKADLIIHAASIGEVRAVAPLITLISDKYPELKILLTVNTPSGRQTAEKIFSDKVNYHYMPIDWHWLAYRYLAHLSPSCVLIVETEIWPNFFEYCFYKGINLFLVNARLSKKSLAAPIFVRECLSEAIRQATYILARSRQDAERFLSLNAQEQYVKVIGNIKYATELQPVIEPITLNRRSVLFASSRDNEELAVTRTWMTACNDMEQQDIPLLVIVPRHIHRSKQIISDLKELNLNIAIRSLNQPVTNNTQVYLADTFGELDNFIASADFVIMGGSFEPHGGQNIIEVGKANKAVVFGPYMENFESEAKEFVSANAAIRVKDQSELKQSLQTLLNDPEKAALYGNNAGELVSKYRNIAKEYLKELEELCSLFNSDA